MCIQRKVEIDLRLLAFKPRCAFQTGPFQICGEAVHAVVQRFAPEYTVDCGAAKLVGDIEPKVWKNVNAVRWTVQIGFSEILSLGKKRRESAQRHEAGTDLRAATPICVVVVLIYCALFAAKREITSLTTRRDVLQRIPNILAF